MLKSYEQTRFLSNCIKVTNLYSHKCNNNFEGTKKGSPWRWHNKHRTCRRQGDNKYTYLITYVHFVGVLDIFYGKMHRMESFKIPVNI